MCVSTAHTCSTHVVMHSPARRPRAKKKPDTLLFWQGRRTDSNGQVVYHAGKSKQSFACATILSDERIIFVAAACNNNT